MFNWLGNLFPYSDLHSLNLDWILSKMKETAAQAAKAVADAANALAQVAEAKAAALTAQTAAQDAQTAANKAAGNAANAAANSVQALNAAQRAQETATAANSAAQNAQTTATNAQTAAQSAQSTAETAKSTAENAQTNVETLNGKFPIKTSDISDKAVTIAKLQYNGVSNVTTDHLQSGNVPMPSATPTDVSQITSELTATSLWNFFNNTRGNFYQMYMEFFDASQVQDLNITCSFAPFYLRSKAVGTSVCVPFIFKNLTTNAVIKGYAQYKRVDTYDYKFQMFFDEPPVFDNGYMFTLHIANIGAVASSHF